MFLIVALSGFFLFAVNHESGVRDSFQPRIIFDALDLKNITVIFFNKDYKQYFLKNALKMFDREWRERYVEVWANEGWERDDWRSPGN